MKPPFRSRAEVASLTLAVTLLPLASAALAAVPPPLTPTPAPSQTPPALSSHPQDPSAHPSPTVPVVRPWRRVALDPDYAGAWVVAGELDGDGTAELVSARNVDRNDVHYTSAVVAQRLDGQVLWRWGDPKVGRKKLHHDVACQIYDWDGDNQNEVVLCAERALVELDGRSGRERRRLPLPHDATDCLVFANLSGGPRATDYLVKTRYTQIWAFTQAGDLLWTVTLPGGHRTAHQPVPIDLDGDGRDEVLAGYAALNADGSTRWVAGSTAVDVARGHCDCFRAVRLAPTPAESRFVMTYCGANNLALLDGLGRPVWELSGHHFESVDVGRVRADVPGQHLVVDVDHRPWGQGPLWILDERGQRLGEIMTDYARHHALVDWTGDGLDEILVAEPRALYDGHGRLLARFEMDAADLGDPRAPEAAEMLGLVGDVTGDGVPDVLLTTRASTAVYVYRNERGRKPNPPAPLGTGVNFTLY